MSTGTLRSADACQLRIRFACKALSSTKARMRMLLQDHYDVKMPAHLLLGKLAGRAPAYVVAALDRLVPPLQKTLTAKLKADAVKQEVLLLLANLTSQVLLRTCHILHGMRPGAALQKTLTAKAAAAAAERQLNGPLRAPKGCFLSRECSLPPRQ